MRDPNATTFLLPLALCAAVGTPHAANPTPPVVTPTSGEGIQYNAPSHLDKIDERREGPLDSAYTFQQTGAGVDIYIVDSGVNIAHSDFGGRATVGYDPFTTSSYDATGHGTHVAGIAAGAVSGVAKYANIKSVRVKNNGQITGAHLEGGLLWIQQDIIAKRNGRSVVNISLEPSFLQSATVRSHVEALIALNAVVVFAAGNSPSFGNRDICQTFIDIPNLYMVGNGDVDGIAYNSYGGPCIDAYAPGAAILSASSGNNTGFVSLTGSSQAAPQAAGVAALILHQYPWMSVADVVAVLNARAVVGKMSQTNGTWVPNSNNRLVYSLPWGQL